MYPTLLAAALAVAVAGDLYDVVMTEKAIAKGAVETSTFLVGSKPSTIALYLRDSLILGLCVAPSLLGATVFHNLPLAYGLLSAPVVYGVKHYLGGHKGKQWLAGKVSDPNKPQSAWQKFLS